ncbi:cytochrome P450 [Mycobacterium conspicuum]|uniref:cytochrome P450 n=1 Tax=Mycobacterium conspicuum TaxID=44010 RepID=UPI000A1535E5|nr:cytochrome P450 [Mycobacterium conspicuum]ORV44222.1 cytochrome [Mycobacterium conspicuum]
MHAGEVAYDPFRKDLDRDPYPVWRRLRDEAPVYRNDEHDFYALSRFDDVLAALTDPDTFRSGYGNLLELMSDEPLGLPYLVMLDDPGHRAHRALTSRAFTPRRVAALEEHVRRLCAELLDAQIGSGGFDFIQDFAALVPSQVISELIGVEKADRERVRRLIDQSLHVESGAGIVNDVAVQAQSELRQCYIRLIEARRDDPRDDLATALSQVGLGTEEAACFVAELVGAGTETTAKLLGWACLLLDEHPDQRARLAGDPAAIGNAVEETLRFQAPSPVQGRRVATDVRLHGTVIPAMSKVLLLNGSANRDEREFADADCYDVTRHIDRHLAFGYGIHHCLGAALARLEARIALQEMLARFPEWEVDRRQVVPSHTSTVRGHHRIPIAV